MNKGEYADYLRSDRWKYLRAAKRRRSKDGPRCAICAVRDDIQTHHVVYRNIFDVTTEDLRLLCNRCHKTVHDLLKSGALDLTPYPTTNGKFTATKTAVKKFLGLTHVNMFNGKR